MAGFAVTEPLDPVEYLDLVPLAARDIHYLTGYEMVELESEGLLVLVEQCRQWQPARMASTGYKPRTFLSYRLHQRLLDWVRKDWGRTHSRRKAGHKRLVSLEGLTALWAVDGIDNGWEPELLQDRTMLECYEERPEEVRLVLALETLAGMDERTRDIVRLYAWEGWPMGRIAAKYGVTESRISQVMTATRKRLRFAESEASCRGH